LRCGVGDVQSLRPEKPVVRLIRVEGKDPDHVKRSNVEPAHAAVAP
jgi:hypothetical protein